MIFLNSPVLCSEKAHFPKKYIVYFKHSVFIQMVFFIHGVFQTWCFSIMVSLENTIRWKSTINLWCFSLKKVTIFKNTIKM